MMVRNGLVAKTTVATAVMLIVALVSYTRAAQATTYDFSGVGVNLAITTGAPDNGGFDITSVTGTVLGDPVSLAGGNPGPGAAISPDGMFIYDNILYPNSHPIFDNPGLLVRDLATTNPLFLYANFFGELGNLSFYTSFNGGYPVANGNFSDSVTATPLPSTWTMMIAALVGLGFFAYRGKRMGPAFSVA